MAGDIAMSANSESARTPMPRILLVEDNPFHQRLVTGMLREAWVDHGAMRHASSLTDAVSVLGEQKFDCVLLDLLLPDSAGMETLLAIRRAAPETPVVVLSSHEEDAAALQALQAGAHDYLVKGAVEASQVRRAVRYAIEAAAVTA